MEDSVIHKGFIALLFLAVLYSLSPAFASQGSGGAKEVKDVEAAPDATASTVRKVLEASDVVGKKIERTAERLDLALAGRRYTDKPNTTSVWAGQLVGWGEGGEVRTSTDFGINLKMPNVERRLQLRFSSFDEREESRDLTQRRVRTRPRRA
ncbi:MAG: hypothetical protein HC902_13875, partial [Calothrix sp. SM1_5_4]|nr:hypothetical protein [Calothrix sp. SM1_5_4]